MDPLVQMIVDILRRGKENDALGQGGPTVGQPGMMVQGIEPKHQNRTYDDIVATMETGR